MLLEGIFLPLTTPFHPDGRIALRKLESNVGRYSLTQAAGMLALGRAGEADGLTDCEVREVLVAAIDAAAEEKVMIAAVGRESVYATLELAEAAAHAGYDAVAVRPPMLATDNAMRLELLTYFRTVADRSPLPLVLVSERERPLPVDAVGELAGHPSIVGLVDDDAYAEQLERIAALTHGVSREVAVTSIFAAVTGRMQRHTVNSITPNFVSAASLGGGSSAVVVAPPRPSAKTRTRRIGFQVLAGSTGRMLEAWSAGATGAIPALGACAPQACCEVWQAFKDGDPALAEEKQHRVRSVAELVEGPRGVALLKYGCDLNAYFGGLPRLPLLGLTRDRRDAMERALAGLHN